MSFDVYIQPAGGEEPVEDGEVWVGNYTANMGAFFAFVLDGVDDDNPSARSDSRDAIFGKRPTTGLVTLHGLTTSQARDRILVGLLRIAGRTDLDRFNAPNGWGSVDTAIRFLQQIVEASEKWPGTLRVSY